MIRSISEYLEELPSIHHSIFRGQQQEEWDLVPSIVRFTDCLVLNETNHPVYGQFSQSLLARFVEQYRFYSREKYDSMIEYMAIAQHYGLPTQLLDWTTNALVALFFACESKSVFSHPIFNDNYFNGAVWQINYGMRHINNIPSDPSDCDIVSLPKTDKRIHNQSGVFTFHAMPLEHEDGGFRPLNRKKVLPQNVVELKKHIIDGAAKQSILYNLEKLGVGYSFIYPDLDGLALSIVENFKYNLHRPYFEIIKSIVKNGKNSPFFKRFEENKDGF